MVRIESGHTPPLRAPTFRKLDRILRWPAGTAQQVYDGQAPPTSDGDVGGQRPVTNGYIEVPIASIVELIETTTALTDVAATQESPQFALLSPILCGLRAQLTPLAGQAVAALLAEPENDPQLSARLGRAVESFMSPV